MPEKGRRVPVLAAGWVDGGVGRGGELGRRTAVWYWRGGSAECDWGWGCGAQGAEVIGETVETTRRVAVKSDVR